MERLTVDYDVSKNFTDARVTIESSPCEDMPELTLLDMTIYSPAKITVAEDNLNYSSDEHGVLFDKDKTTLIYCRPNIEVETYTIPSTVTEICKEAFYGCKNLATI